MNINEKATYIKGLADGLTLNENSAEGKVLKALLDLTYEMASKITSLEEQVDELESYVEDIDEGVQEDIETLYDYADELDHDLGEVEEYLCDETDFADYDEDDYDDDDEDDGECDFDCDNCCMADECGMTDDDDYFEVVCPSCGETVCFDESVDPDNLVCPACGEKFECVVEEDDLKALDGDEE